MDSNGHPKWIIISQSTPPSLSQLDIGFQLTDTPPDM
jgi:hypothetical protein